MEDMCIGEGSLFHLTIVMTIILFHFKNSIIFSKFFVCFYIQFKSKLK